MEFLSPNQVKRYRSPLRDGHRHDSDPLLGHRQPWERRRPRRSPSMSAPLSLVSVSPRTPWSSRTTATCSRAVTVRRSPSNGACEPLVVGFLPNDTSYGRVHRQLQHLERRRRSRRTAGLPGRSPSERLAACRPTQHSSGRQRGGRTDRQPHHYRLRNNDDRRS